MCDFAKYLALSGESARYLGIKCWVSETIVSENVGIDQSTDKRRSADSEFCLRLQCASLTVCLLPFSQFAVSSSYSETAFLACAATLSPSVIRNILSQCFYI